MRAGGILRGCLSLCAFSLMLNCSLATGFCQESATNDADEVAQIMKTALARCFSTVNGVKRISFVPATSEETSEVTRIGYNAIPQLASYIDLPRKDDLTQLLAVKFLISIGLPETYPPLERALKSDQWELTRVQALSGLFELSHETAKPFIENALTDSSTLVRERAKELWKIENGTGGIRDEKRQ
jgi:HEAT repeat protein